MAAFKKKKKKQRLNVERTTSGIGVGKKATGHTAL